MHERLPRTPSLLGLALLVGLVVAASTASAGEVVTRQDYVAGLSTPQNTPVQHQAAVCTSNANVGGICEVPVPTETNLAILVDDTGLGRVPFHWQALTENGQAGDCPHGHSIGEDTLTLPPACPKLDVYVSLTATEGQITIEKADVVII